MRLGLSNYIGKNIGSSNLLTTQEIPSDIAEKKLAEMNQRAEQDRKRREELEAKRKEEQAKLALAREEREKEQARLKEKIRKEM